MVAVIYTVHPAIVKDRLFGSRLFLVLFLDAEPIEKKQQVANGHSNT